MLKRRDSTLAHNLTWFGKSAYIHGTVYIIEIYRERITIYMEEEDHFTLSTPSYYCCTCSCCNGSKAAAIAALHFLSCSLHFSPLSSRFALLSCCLFIGKNGATSSNTSSTKVAANSSSSSTMVAANSQWLVLSICCTCNGNNPTITPFAIHVGQLSSCFFSTGLHLAALPNLPF